MTDNNIYLLAGALFFLVLLYQTFAFANYIPHFLISVYFVLPLFYKLAHLKDLSLTTVFVLLMGPVILWRSNPNVIASFWPVAIYLIMVIITSLANNVSMWENKSAFMPLTVALLSAVSLSNRDVEKRIRIFTYVIIGWIAINSVFSILQLTLGKAFYFISATNQKTSVLGVERGYGLIGMATEVGVTFCLGVPLIGTLLLDDKRRKPLLFILFILGSIGLIAAFSRGAIFGVSIAVFSLLLFHKKYKLLATYFVAGVLLYTTYSALMLLLPDNYSSFLQGKDGSASARVPFTMLALKMFADRPLTGFGFGGFSEYCTQYGSKIHIEAHNTYAQVLVEYGLIGFLSFLFVIGRSVKGFLAYIRTGASAEIRVLAIGYLSALVAILIDATVHCFEWNLVLWVPVMFGYLMQYLKNNEARMAADIPVQSLADSAAREGCLQGRMAC
jgi:hypothetical protein